MSEVAEVGEGHAAVREHACDLLRIERLVRQRVRTFSDESQHDERRQHGEQREDAGVDAPVAGADDVHEIRRRFAERERADENAEGEATAGLEPRRDDLHPRRIDAGEKHTGEKAQRDRDGDAGREPSQQRIRNGAEKRAEREETADVEDVGKIQRRAEERAGDEAELHAEREPRGRRGIELPLLRDLRRDRGHAEPETHRQKLGEGDEREGTIAMHFWPRAWYRARPRGRLASDGQPYARNDTLFRRHRDGIMHSFKKGTSVFRALMADGGCADGGCADGGWRMADGGCADGRWQMAATLMAGGFGHQRSRHPAKPPSAQPSPGAAATLAAEPGSSPPARARV